MKRFYTLMLAFVFCVSFRALGQTLTLKDNANINANCNGYIEILPQGYNPLASTTYPTIIFFMGINSDGPGTTASLQSMISGVPGGSAGNGFIQDQVTAGIFPTTFSNGNKFIIIVPQFIINYNVRPPTPAEVNDVINRVVSVYKVDTTRLYLTGNSSGGGPVWDYPAASSAYADRIAAIVPFCAVSFPSKEKADVIRNARIAVWAFHNDFDGVPSAFTKDYVTMINRPTTAIPEVKQTIFPVGGHDCWYQPYMRLYTEGGLNIYDWMLQFQRTVTKANAGVDQNITLPTATAQLSGSGTGPGGGVTSVSWQKISGPAGGGLSNTTILNPTISGLVNGTYLYRLSVTDGTGTATDDVVVTVYPPRIQAEFPVNSFGVSTSGIANDEGGGNIANGFGVGDFVEYTINVPAAGTYQLRFRLSAFFQNPAFVVKLGGNVIATVPVYWTMGHDNYITMSRTVVLPAGTQTIRIESTSAEDFNLNWIQLLSGVFSGPLPVKFSLLNASCENGKVKINWRTDLEENLESFDVEKNSDGRTWKVIANIQATGQSNSEQNYFYIDAENGSNSQYRIAGIDHDGKKTYSTIIKGNCGTKYSFSVYPNPVRDETQISLVLEKAARVKLIVADNKGAVVIQQERSVLQGANLLPLNLSSLPAGSYTLTIQWDAEIKSVKLVKK